MNKLKVLLLSGIAVLILCLPIYGQYRTGWRQANVDSLKFKEQASAPSTPVSKIDLIYVDSSSELRYKNNAGEDVPISAFGTDTLTTSSDDPGTGTATLDEILTYLISDDTGVETDVVTLPDGTFEGQIKKFILLTDGESEGTVVAPTNVTMVGGAGTSTKMQDPGDFVEFTWNSTLGWTLTGNTNATIQ